MKKIFLILFLLPLVCSAQSIGKYYSAQIGGTTTVTTSQTYPIEVQGDNYSWEVDLSWGTATLTTTTAKIQASRDNSVWFNWAGMPIVTLSGSNTGIYFTDDSCPFPYIRLVLTVTGGDALGAFKAGFTVKRKF